MDALLTKLMLESNEVFDKRRGAEVIADAILWNTSEVQPNAPLNERPIIGILAQELNPSLQEVYGDNYTSYIGAAYVKYVESAGARVVPVLINQTDEYYEMIFNSTNGLLIPGGRVSLSTSGKLISNYLFY